MAGPPDHRALPTSTWRPHDPALGGAPRDGDFARLLEAASAPRAHRMKVDPEVEALGLGTRRRARAPYGSPKMNWGRALPLPGRPGGGGGGGAGEDADGAARLDTTADSGNQTAADDAAFGAGASRPARPGARPWSGRRLRDRVVAILFALAGLWILLNVLDAATHRGAEDLGPLVVLAVVAFFVLRGWLRARRPPTDSR
jgi:hypothetical protein